MGIREGLLVLLADGPRHGYQLKHEFESATGDAWPLNVGQVYTTLQRLERDLMVKTVDEDDDGRHVYELTPAGRAEAVEWFTEPVDRKVIARDEVSMKVLMALVAGLVPVDVVIARQRATTMTALQDYTRLKSETSTDEIAWLLHLDRLVFQAEAELRWLDLTEDRLKTPGPPRHRATAALPDRQEAPNE